MSMRFHYCWAFPLAKADSQRLHANLAAETHGPAPQHGIADAPSAIPDSAVRHALCVAKLAESQLTHPFLRQRVSAAMPEVLPAAFPIKLTLVSALTGAAALSHPNAQTRVEIDNFLGRLALPLAAQSIDAAPLRPYVALPHMAKPRSAVPHPFEWTADRLVLLEIDQLNAGYRILQTWALSPPLQGSLPFPIAA